MEIEPLAVGLLFFETDAVIVGFDIKINLLSIGVIGGGSGIRTHAPFDRPTGFQDRTLQPLGYPSI